MYAGTLFPIDYWTDPMAKPAHAAAIAILTALRERIEPVFYHDSYRRPTTVLAPMPDDATYWQRANGAERRIGSDEIDGMVIYPLLSREQELHLFRQLGYHRWRVHRRIVKRQTHCTSARLAQQVVDDSESDLVAIANISDIIARSNIRLALCSAKQCWNSHHLADLYGEVLFALARSIRRFDWRKGHKLSTYATWAITRSLSDKVRRFRADDAMMTQLYDDKLLPKQLTTVSDHEEMLWCDDMRAASSHIAALLQRLTDRERDIIRYRFGLDNEPTLTLERIGERIGVSKERVRQLEKRAIEKMRK